MPQWVLPLAVTAAGSAAALAACGALLLAPPGVRRRIVPSLVAFAAGTLLAGALLVLLPHAAEKVSPISVLRTSLVGFVSFFLLERLVLWRHCHHRDCSSHSPAGALILVGDALHNFVDGTVIAAGFLSSVPIGVATALAVFAHEVPQEIGDFAILLESGYSRLRALTVNALSASSAVLGAAAGYFLLERVEPAVPHLMAFSAAGFLYIAVADLIPQMHKEPARRGTLQVLLVLAGVATIALLDTAEH